MIFQKTKRIKNFIIFIIYVSSLLSEVYANSFGKSPGQAGFSFLKIPMSARAVAMGEAFVGIPDDAQSVEHNPAGPATLKTPELWVSHLSYLENINAESVTMSRPYPKTAFSFHARFLHAKDTFRDRAGIESGDFSNRSWILNPSYSYKVTPSFYLGAGVKYISEKLASSQAGAAALDLGSFYQFSRVPFSMAASLQNIGPDAKFEAADQSLPLTLRIGGTSRIGYRIFSSVEILQSLDRDLEFKTGAEYYVSSFLVLRTGFKLNQKKLEDFNGISGGIGFVRSPFSIDYAFVPSSDLGFTHRVSLGLKWQKVSAEQKEEVLQTVERIRKIEEEQKLKAEPAKNKDELLKSQKLLLEIGDKEYIKFPQLADLHFEHRSSNLDAESMLSLSEHIKFLEENAELDILIEGHCDDSGTKEYNFTLGQKRAETIKKIYRSFGINGDRISTLSQGNTQPLCFVPTEECRNQNRRIEIKVRRKGGSK